MRKKKTNPSAAIADSAFLLLLFFMVLAIESPHHNQPKAQQIDINTLPVIELIHHTLTLNNKRIELNDIPYQKHYTLKASNDTPFKYIDPIIVHLTELGVDTITCLVKDSF